MDTAELAAMEPLTEAERSLVAEAMPQLRQTLGQRRFMGFVHALGRERCWDAGTSAYMRAVKKYRPHDYNGIPFSIYAAFWVRKFLIDALAEVAREGTLNGFARLIATFRRDDPSPETLAEWRELIAVAFRVLPTREREVLMLRSAGLSWPEVGKAMGCCLNVVRRRHVRAMKRIWKFAPELREGCLWPRTHGR